MLRSFPSILVGLLGHGSRRYSCFRGIWCWVLLTCLLGAAQAAVAQPALPSEFRFEHLSVDEGLAHSDATAVTQDKTGFIWVGTNHGLDRYDGYELKPYALPVNALNGLSANRIRTLYSDRAGQLWVGTERAGLSFYDASHDRFRSLAAQPVSPPERRLLRQLAQADVSSLVSDMRGRLWVGTNQGLFVLTLGPDHQQVQSLALIPPAAAPRQAFTVSALAIDQQGNLWVGAYNVGLQIVDATAARPVARATPVATASVRALHLDRRGDLWVGTNHTVLWVHGAAGRRPEELTATALPQRLPFLQSLHLDSFNRLWVGTIYGLYVWEPGPPAANYPPLQPTPPHRFLPSDGETHSLNAEQVYQIFEGRNQLLWLCAAAGGLNWVNLRQKPFGRIRQQLLGQATLPNNYVNAIYKEEARNLLWYGTRNGAACYNLTTRQFRYYFNQQLDTSEGNVLSIFQSSNGTLWFGTRGNGLMALTRLHGHDHWTTYTTVGKGALELSQLSIESIAEDRYGMLWLGTREGGLYHLTQDGRLLNAYSAPHHPLPTAQFTYLLYDRTKDVLWASTCDAGLLKLRVTLDSVVVMRQFSYHSPPGQRLQVNYTWPLLFDRQGALWIGTIGGGLHQLVTDAKGREMVRSYQPELPESEVESLLADDDGNLWVGGTGLYRFRPSTGQYLRYDVSDGLQSNAFKVGAAYRAQDGTLYFGGKNGISYFQPRAVQPNPYPPVVQLTGLRVHNEPVGVGTQLHGRVLLAQALAVPQQLTIKASENDFSVDFVALNFASPQKTRYAYQLEGYHHGWVQPAAGQRTASFANLPPGHYTLRVKASNGEGVWSRQPASMQFTVLAPWYRTGWAYLLYALAALGAVAIYRRIELRQQRLQSQLVLEQFQAEKEKELTDLKLGFFTNISHELRTPLTLILGPLEELITGAGSGEAKRHDKLQLMHRQARKLLELVNQLLDFRKVETGHVPLRASHDDAISFLASLYPVFRLRAEEKGIDYGLDIPAEPVRLYFDRSKLEIILTNLLANAFTYTPAHGRVELAATVVGNPGGEAAYSQEQLAGNYLKITISDTGTGIRASELARIFDPYYQAAHTAARRIGGTGIGLSLAKQFAERHQGQLSVVSTEGIGTTFELRLPFGRQHLHPDDMQPESPLTELTDDAPTLPPPSEPNLGAPALAAKLPSLLLVEDNDEVRQYLSQLFEDSYEVLTAEDGQAGWKKALGHLPDLIISDVMMPHSDGLDLCRQLKQHPKTGHIPVVLLTARTAALHELEGIGVGADDYVSKPFNPQVLQAKVQTLLRNRRQLREYYQRQILLEPTEIVVADADRQFLDAAMAAVERNLDNPEFSVQMLAREVGLSQTLCYRRLKGVTGQTAVEFIRDVRMKRAAQLLAQTQMRVSEVAFQVGIVDEKYFRKTFQKIYGVVPSEYIRQHRLSRESSASAS